MTTDSDAESLIEAALDQAFSAPPLRKQAPGPAPISASNVSIDTWKADYDEQVRSWHAESAEARARAVKERTRWETIRAAEREKAALEPHEPEWESVAKKEEGSAVVPDVPEANDTFERPGEHIQGESSDDSQKWEEIHSSQTSSFPSMTFPERTTTSSPSPGYNTVEPPRTATLAIFDPSLSTRTRLRALFASLAINLLLPFVNGVMLGFGEIFAKEVVIGWFGWKKSGSIAASAGIHTSPQRRRRST